MSLIHGRYTNQEIADQLVIECGTVKNHVHNILKKLEVSNRHEAASLFQMHQPAMAMA
ncbi:MAG: LuxR C-terminal-related transcriptional regulator [Chloroflexi bacterium]|nr:LuxR C-terminal-related transcriptional regulator [Chloroflexota bacterium]